jgi:aryl-alcohol dehydrogenase-like predicted oxidoreductase
VRGDPEYVKIAFEKSLKRLGGALWMCSPGSLCLTHIAVDHVDLYYQHRYVAVVPS